MDEKSVFPAGFPYEYEMTLSLARPGSAFTEEDRRTLEEGIAAYNEKSIYMANPKKLELLEMGNNYINLKLSSTQLLATPGRGLRTLTAILLENPSPCFRDRVTPGGQLFRVISINQPTVQQVEVNPSSISDADFLAALIHYVVDKKEGSTAGQLKRAALTEMKKLAVEARIIERG